MIKRRQKSPTKALCGSWALRSPPPKCPKRQCIVTVPLANGNMAAEGEAEAAEGPHQSSWRAVSPRNSARRKEISAQRSVVIDGNKE